MKAGTRPSPAAAAPDLGEACARLGLTLTTEQIQRLERYVDLLLRWNTAYNLTAIRDPAKVWTHHLFDCLALVGPLRRHRAGRPLRRVLDVGSGAGLPGLILAITEPDLNVLCVDSVGKKVAFIQQAIAELGLANASAAHLRIETLQAETFDVVVSRAFASLRDFISSTRHLLAVGGEWLAMKGKVPAAEIAELGSAASFHVEQLVVPGLDAERCLIWMQPL